MIEANDINDSVIIDATRQEKNTRGAIRFILILPSGKEFSCDWIPEGQQQGAIVKWIAVAKEAVIDDITAARREKVAAAKAAKADDAVLTQEVTKEGRTAAVGLPADTVLDPSDHARHQVTLLEAEERHWLAEFQTAQKNLDTTRKLLLKWKQIIASFDATGDDNE